jgi:hypothetical protein
MPAFAALLDRPGVLGLVRDENSDPTAEVEGREGVRAVEIAFDRPVIAKKRLHIAQCWLRPAEIRGQLRSAPDPTSDLRSFTLCPIKSAIRTKARSCGRRDPGRVQPGSRREREALGSFRPTKPCDRVLARHRQRRPGDHASMLCQHHCASTGVIAWSPGDSAPRSGR